MTNPIEKMTKADLNALLPEAERYSVAQLRKVTAATLRAMVGRRRALSGRSADRIFFKPVKRSEDLKLPRAGTKRALIVQALADGVTVDDLAARLGWTKATAQSAIYTDIRPMGLGVERRVGSLWLITPKDFEKA